MPRSGGGLAALSGWVSIRRFLGVPLMKSFPLKWATARRMYEENRHARHQLQGQNGTTDGAGPASVDNTLGHTNPMNKTHLLGVYSTSKNHIQLAYASLIIWSYEDTPAFFEELYGKMEGIPKPFPEIVTLVHDRAAMRIACEELYESAHRSALKELFPLTKLYCHESGQLDNLKSQPWFQFWRILRNCFAHDMLFNFNKDEKALLPVHWSGVTIDISMNGRPLTHGQCSREKLRELFEVAHSFVVKNVA